VQHEFPSGEFLKVHLSESARNVAVASGLELLIDIDVSYLAFFRIKV